MDKFDFQQSYHLENDRVLLRPLVPSDIEHLKPFSLNEADLWQYSLIRADGLDNLKSYLNKALDARKVMSAYPFIVYDKQMNEYAGSTRFYDIQLHHNTANIGYTWYGKKFQRTGLNRHCKLLLLEFAFEKIGFDRIELRADYNNKKSVAAMKAIGCVQEGVLRSNCKSPTGRRDSIILSMLRSEWLEGKKEHLKSITR